MKSVNIILTFFEINLIMVKDLEIKDRILEAITAGGGNKSDMARKIGVTPNYLASVLTSENKGVSATLMKGFAEAGIDTAWLITGQNEELDSWKNKADLLEQQVAELEKRLEVSNLLVQHLEDKLYPTNKII